MSLPDRAFRTRTVLASLAALAIFAAGCTVQPLYGTNGVSAAGTPVPGVAAELASIEVAPVNTRIAQQARNHLIFLFTGGQGRTDNPRYRLDLTVRPVHAAAARITRRVDDEPTSQTLTVTATYRLIDSSTGEPVATGTRSAMAAYDLSRQEFAALRARRDAEDRGAREVAELIRMAVAADLSRRAPGS
ncbi:MAG: LPS assembly lipoprotein LptE [Rhizobiaceae bacterium]